MLAIFSAEFSDSFLELLVDTVHIQMKMLESFAKSKEVLLVRREKKIRGGGFV